MTINIGANPWILIVLMFLEVLFIIIPALIAMKIEKNSFKDQLNEMGFHKNEDPLPKNLIKISAGIGIGILFFLIGGYIVSFFYLIVEATAGSDFVLSGTEGAIRTSPVKPDIIQVIVLIILQVAIVGVCEEGFFRGFLLKKIDKEWKGVYALLLSSVIFAFYHVPPFIVPITTIITYFGYYFTFGVLLSLVYIYSDYSLIPGIIAHALYNILLMIL